MRSNHLVCSKRDLEVLEEAIDIVKYTRTSGDSLKVRLESVDLSIHFPFKSGLRLARRKLARLVGKKVGILRTDDSSVVVREISRRPRRAQQPSSHGLGDG
jgi:hypothetical protein